MWTGQKYFESALALVVSCSFGFAQATTLEPDDFIDGTILNAVSPQVTLSVEVPNGSGGLRISSFDVTSTDGDFGQVDASPTGTRVFAHENIEFFNNSRILRGDFTGVTNAVSIAFAPSSTLTPQTGRLEVYGIGGNLLGFDTTTSLLANNSALTTDTLSVTRPGSDIAFFRAYTSEGEFGRFDNLTFATPVPEPAGAALLVFGLVALSQRRRDGQ